MLGQWMRAACAVAVLGSGLLLGCGSSGRTYMPKSDRTPDVPPPPARASVPVNPALKVAAREELDKSLAASDALIRAHAVEAAREALGSGARRQLLNALQDRDPLVRFAACMSCGEIRLQEARERLMQLTTDPSEHVQIGAVFALHRLGDVRYSQGLEKALNSPQKEVRANAAFALGRLGEKSAIKILRPLIRDSAVEVRLQAAEAMWRLGDEQGLETLVAASLSANPAYQMVALLALAGPRDGRVRQHVRAGLGADYIEVKLVAARALAWLGSDEAYVAATEATTSKEARQRYLAALALGAIGRADAQESLAPLLKDVDADVRVAAAAAILELR